MGVNVPVIINDVTLREGDQAPLTSFNREEKMIIALMLQELGVDNIEAGFAASRVDYDNIKGVFEVLDPNGPVIASLGRATEYDTTQSLSVIKGHKNARVHIFLATSDEHIEAKFGSKGKDINEKRKWLLEQVKNEVGRVKKFKNNENSDTQIEFSPEDATGNALTEKVDGKKYLDFESEEFHFLVEVCKTAILSGATVINTPDTLGNLLSHETEMFFKELTKRLQPLRDAGYQFDLSAHIHNDLGMASANAIAALRGGATQIELTINGIGERTGNTSLHEILGIIGEKGHAILDEGEVQVSPSIEMKLVGPTSEFVRRILNHNKSLQEPFIGALSDVDGSGVHNAAQDVYGGTKNKAKYGGASMPEFFSPRGGANQIVSMLQGYGVEIDRTSQLVEAVTTRACLKSEQVKSLYAPNVYSLYMKELGDFSISKINISGKNVEMRMVINGEEVVISGEGEGENGYIDATIQAINSFLGEKRVDIGSIEIKNKPSLSDAYERYVSEVSEKGVELSKLFTSKVETIINGIEGTGEKSQQLGIGHVKVIVDGEEVSSVSSANNSDYAMVKAILDACLSQIMEKISTNGHQA